VDVLNLVGHGYGTGGVASRQYGEGETADENKGNVGIEVTQLVLTMVTKSQVRFAVLLQ